MLKMMTTSTFIRNKAKMAMRIPAAIVSMALLYIFSPLVPAQAATGTGGTGGISLNFVLEDGSTLTQRNKINFIGAAVTCVDNAGQIRTDCTITSGGGGAGNPMEVFSNFDGTRSSPTSSISIGDSLKLSVVGSTAVISVDFSSVTSRSDAILNQASLQSGAKFHVSSASIDGQLFISGGSIRTILLPSTTEAMRLVNISSHQVFMVIQSSGTTYWKIGSDVTGLQVPSYDIYNAATGLKDVSISTSDVMSINATAAFPGLTASRPLKLNSTNKVISDLIDLTSDVTNTLPSGNLPTNVAYTNVNQTFSGSNVFTSSQTFGQIKVSTIIWANGTIQVSSPSAGGAGGTPGGSNTNVQFNNSGVFGGDNGFQYDSSVSSVTINGALGVSGTLLNDRPSVSAGPFAARSAFSFDPSSSDPTIQTRSYNAVAPNHYWTIYDYQGNNPGALDFAVGNGSSFAVQVASCTTCTKTNGYVISGNSGVHQILATKGTNFGNPLVTFDSVGNSSFTIPVSVSLSQDELISVRRQNAAGANKNALINFYTNTGSGDSLQNSFGYFNTNGTGFGLTDSSGNIQWRMARTYFPDKLAMRIYNVSGANYVALQSSSSLSSNLEFTLPLADGTNGQALVTNGTGQLSFTTISGGSGGSGGYAVEPATVTFNLAKGVLISTAVINQTLTGNTTAMMIISTGTGNALLVIGNGVPAGGLQGSKGGIVNITRNSLSDGLVIYSSVTSAQAGSTMLGLINDNTGYNDPLIWIHNNGNSSNPFMRVDDQAPDFEIVNTSTDNAIGLGKWEPFAMAYQGTDLQVNSRAYNNGTFETVAKWTPLSKGGGLTLSPVILGQDGNPTTSNTQALVFVGTNSSSVGLTGPKAPAGSWTFRLPPRFANGGQVLYQTADNPRDWDFTTGGVRGQSLKFNSTSGAPYWSLVSLSTEVTGTLPLANMVSSVTVAGTLVAGSNITITPGSGITTISATGGGGGGSSSLEVFNNFNGSRSSPTASIGMSNAFAGSVTGSTFTFAMNTSSVTLYGPNIPAASISAGSLGASVLASSFPAIVAPGSYGSTTIAPVITINAQGQVTSLSSATIAGGGGSGSNIYPATGTASFPYGFSSSTGVFSGDISAVNVTGSGYVNGDIVYVGNVGSSNYFKLFVAGGLAPEIDFFYGGVRKAVFGYDSGSTRSTFYADHAAMGIHFFTTGKAAVGPGVNDFALNQLQVDSGTNADSVLVNPQASTAKGLVVKGAASQSANLQEWQNSSSVVLSSVSASGSITAPTFTAKTSIVFGDGTTQTTAATGGSGDMILASTQTSTGAKSWNSYSNFIGSSTFQNLVGFRGVVLSSSGYASSTGSYTTGTGGFLTNSGSFNAGSAFSTFSGSPGLSQVANSAAQAGSLYRAIDNQNRSATVPTHNSIVFTYAPANESSNFSGGANFGILSTSNTVSPGKTWATIGATNGSSMDTGGATDYFRIDVSTVNQGTVGQVDVLTGGIVQRVGGSIFTMTASSTSANTTSAINLVGAGAGTLTIPASYWSIGKSIKVKGTGYYSSTTTTPGDFTLRVNVGTNTVFTSNTGSYVVSQSSQVFAFSATITCRATGASGSLMGQTVFGIYDATNGFIALPSVNVDPVTLDLSIPRTIAFTWQDTVASSRNTKTLTNFVLSSE